MKTDLHHQIINYNTTNRDVIRTEKYNIYKLSKDVYDKKFKFVLWLTDSQFEYALCVYKYPNAYYKKKLDDLLDGHPESFKKNE